MGLERDTRETKHRFTDFYEAWQFLVHHKTFSEGGTSRFTDCLSIDVVKVNPVTKRAEKDKKLNTATRIWLECGPWLKAEEVPKEARETFPEGVASHAPCLDCGAPTFEAAIVKLANLVMKHYGI